MHAAAAHAGSWAGSRGAQRSPLRRLARVRVRVSSLGAVRCQHLQLIHLAAAAAAATHWSSNQTGGATAGACRRPQLLPTPRHAAPPAASCRCPLVRPALPAAPAGGGSRRRRQVLLLRVRRRPSGTRRNMPTAPAAPQVLLLRCACVMRRTSASAMLRSRSRASDVSASTCCAASACAGRKPARRVRQCDRSSSRGSCAQQRHERLLLLLQLPCWY